MVFKTPGEIELMDDANRIVHGALDLVAERVVPGVTTRELDGLAEEYIRSAGGVPAFLNYRGFPATLCTSVNDVIVHGIPNDDPLEEGAIIGVDCGVIYKGYYGDAARTFEVGEVGAEAQRLLVATRESLDQAIAAVQPGGRLSDIGHAVEKHVEARGYSVVREFVGHGIGSALHEERGESDPPTPIILSPCPSHGRTHDTRMSGDHGRLPVRPRNAIGPSPA